jgi:hydrogenase-4 membrane subunit HyfE
VLGIGVIIELMSSGMVLLAIGIASARSIGQMIGLYVVQSALLACLTVLIAFEGDEWATTFFGLALVFMWVLLGMIRWAWLEVQRSSGPMKRLLATLAVADVLLVLILFALVNWNPSGILVGFALLVPGTQIFIITPLLAGATDPQESHWVARLTHLLRSLFYSAAISQQSSGLQRLFECLKPPPFRRLFQSVHQTFPFVAIRPHNSVKEEDNEKEDNEKEEDSVKKEKVPATAIAAEVWLRHSLGQGRQFVIIGFSLLLILLALLVAFSFEQPESRLNRIPSLLAALALLLIGVAAMLARRDLISQVIGLLIVDEGLFLAVVRGLQVQRSLIPVFIVSLFLYIGITLVILVALLPTLHVKSGTIEVRRQAELRESADETGTDVIPTVRQTTP